MIKQYSDCDIEKWADYSGDRNSVHFDKDVAIKIGLKDIIVQGMLVLIDAKQMLSPYIKGDASINIYIKKPVLINTDIKFSIQEKGNKVFLTVAESDNSVDVCATATVISQKPFPVTENLEQSSVSSGFIKTQLDLLKNNYPHIVDDWLIMDTLLFSVCFNQRKDDYFYLQSKKIANNNNSNSIATYHVAHNIFVSQRLLAQGDIDLSNITYSMEEKDVYVNDDSVYSLFNVNASESGEIIFQSSIGCLTKSSSI